MSGSGSDVVKRPLENDAAVVKDLVGSAISRVVQTAAYSKAYNETYAKYDSICETNYKLFNNAIEAFARSKMYLVHWDRNKRRYLMHKEQFACVDMLYDLELDRRVQLSKIMSGNHSPDDENMHLRNCLIITENKMQQMREQLQKRLGQAHEDHVVADKIMYEALGIDPFPGCAQKFCQVACTSFLVLLGLVALSAIGYMGYSFTFAFTEDEWLSAGAAGSAVFAVVAFSIGMARMTVRRRGRVAPIWPYHYKLSTTQAETAAAKALPDAMRSVVCAEGAANIDKAKIKLVARELTKYCGYLSKDVAAKCVIAYMHDHVGDIRDLVKKAVKKAAAKKAGQRAEELAKSATQKKTAGCVVVDVENLQEGATATATAGKANPKAVGVFVPSFAGPVESGGVTDMSPGCAYASAYAKATADRSPGLRPGI